MQNEEEKKREGQKNPEDFLQKIGKEMNNLKNDIVENTIDLKIQKESLELDNLQNIVIGHIEQDNGLTKEKGKILGEAKNKLGSVKKEISRPSIAPTGKEEVVPLEVIRANQTRSRLNIEQKLVPIAGMPRRLVNKLDASN